MMNAEDKDILRTLALEIEAISPVHIGSGDLLNRKFTLYSAQRGVMGIASQQKLLAAIGGSSTRATQFVGYCESATSNLDDLLKRWGVTAEAVTAYALRCERQPNEVRAFIRSAEGAGRAYLPGSSLKGAIRSALARAICASSPEMLKRLRDVLEQLAAVEDARDDDERERRHKERERRRIRQRVERLVFGRKPKDVQGDDSNYDLLRYLQITDSNLLDDAQMAVCAVDVMSSQRDKTLKRRFNEPTFVEAIAPGARLRCKANVLTMLSRPDLPAATALVHLNRNRDWVETFYASCRSAGAALMTQEIAFYRIHSGEVAEAMLDWFERQLAKLQSMPETVCLLPIGWGSGFDPKTVTDLVAGDLFERVADTSRYTKRLGRPGGSGPWLGAPLVPKTRKVTQLAGAWYPIGWLKVATRVQDG